ncbi:MAG: hypothetical protein NT003_01640, partial [Candidatus Magasanikbacteria bacterium]|nr:hypothetical protein [Candidatus Magasanikbacteria bacterium]
VVSYKIRIGFNTQDARIKSGLTANISILTLNKENVLKLPSYALTETDTSATVEKLNADGSTTQSTIVIGSRGGDNTVEIVSGLNENDRVIAVGLK